jgi:hypothetical protein
MGVWKWITSEFYAIGCGLTGMSTAALDEAVAANAKAHYGDNNLTMTWPDGRKTYHHVHIGNRTRAAKWVHKFNDRAGAGTSIPAPQSDHESETQSETEPEPGAGPGTPRRRR